MDIKEVRKLINLMNANDLVEVEVESGESRVLLKKAGANAPGVMPQLHYGASAAVPTSVASSPSTADATEADDSVSIEGDSVTFNSPMVGTFYVASGPGNEPFVRIGDRVSPTSVLCIVEAMKVMNEIAAETTGEILEVLVGDGEAVEYGQPLFTIRPS